MPEELKNALLTWFLEEAKGNRATIAIQQLGYVMGEAWAQAATVMKNVRHEPETMRKLPDKLCEAFYQEFLRHRGL